MTDGYHVYHSIAHQKPDDIRVAGCWAHLKRRYASVVKASGKAAKGTIAEEGNQRIAAIYHIDNMYKGKPAEERLEHRHDSVEPLVDAYFAWVKTLAARPDIDKSTETGKAITYSLNQEKFLREFLTDAMIPIDNNDAERSVKNFCVAKHSWNVIGTKNGAKASAMLYSIAETAKANNLKTFDYFKYLLEQILLHLDDDPKEYLEIIMPWSNNLPENCYKKK